MCARWQCLLQLDSSVIWSSASVMDAAPQCSSVRISFTSMPDGSRSDMITASLIHWFWSTSHLQVCRSGCSDGIWSRS